jgi:hypothetical protein
MTYYDYGKDKNIPKNAILVAAADSYYRVIHVFKGFVRGNELTIYPYQVCNPSFQPLKRTMHVDSLLPRERLKIDQERARHMSS